MSATVETSMKSRIVDAIEIPILTRCCFCVPLRRGLITFAYLNLLLTLAAVTMLSLFMSYQRLDGREVEGEYPRLVVDTAALVLETVMTVVFIVALHMKHLVLMKLYLGFEVVFSCVSFVYSVAFLSRESASELFILLSQLMLQIYLSILIWSSIVNIQRNGTVKYTREKDDIPA